MKKQTTVGRSSRRVGAAREGGLKWDGCWLGTIIHSHLDASDDAIPLPEIKSLGKRDALSLLGQFAAHLAFLRFAGIGNSQLVLGDWAAVRTRGRDARLVRVGGPPPQRADEMLPITLLSEFAEEIGAPALEVLGHTWTRPEAAYAEVLRTMQMTSGHDASLRESAWGAVRAPGATLLREVTTRPGVTLVADVDAAISTVALGMDVVVCGDEATPLQKWSAVRTLIGPGDKDVSEAQLVERIVGRARDSRKTFVITNWSSFDAASRTLVRLLIDAGDPLSWILPAEMGSMVPSHRRAMTSEPTRWFVLSTRVAAEREILLRVPHRGFELTRSWCQEFVQSDEFNAFVLDGEVKDAGGGTVGLVEPTRSFASALALLGEQFSVEIATELLEQIGFGRSLPDLISEGILVAEPDDEVRFTDESLRRRLAAGLDDEVRRSIAGIASELTTVQQHELLRISLLLQAESFSEAECIAEEISWERVDPDRLLRMIGSSVAAHVKSCPNVVAMRCRGLVDVGRYADASREAAELEGVCGNFIRAMIHRRLGDYRAALEELGHLSVGRCSFDAALLSGEVHRLEGHHDNAKLAFARCREVARTNDERGRLAYEEALLAFDHGMQGPEDELPSNPYYEARYLFYEAAGDGDLKGAVEWARRAQQRATNVPDKVDAELDLVFALFLAGDWDAARHEARSALILIEETQGDRAAAGILFTLAFLCADSGQWRQAEQKIDRLQLFYKQHEDERRERELDLLRAHLALCKLELSTAERLTNVLMGESLSAEMHEAVALIQDEIAWLRGELKTPRSSGESQCLELTRRHLLFANRTAGTQRHRLGDSFLGVLSAWETERRRGKAGELPTAVDAAERLILLRAFLAMQRRHPDPKLVERIHDLAVGAGIADPLATIDGRKGQPGQELNVIGRAAIEAFPYHDESLGRIDWKLISRTRTGRWSQSGSLPDLDESDAEGILEEPPRDWVRCGARAAIHVGGLGSWSEGSVLALVAVVETKMENANLRRLTMEPPLTTVPSGRSVDGLVGESAAIRRSIDKIGTAARRESPVCIEGESGTGKELFARAIHDQSARRNRPFMPVNCAALPENLIESELFGSVRGAFTGADRDREGLIEAADEGTLFLDEIGEMSLPAQAKLLRFLQEGEFRRVGETRSRHADVRIIAATNRRLEEAVDNGEFRDDLYYRIRVIEIEIPPLRERSGDTVLLARWFLAEENRKHGAGPVAFAAEVEEIFQSHDWPGNVRELQSTVRAAHAIAGDRKIVTLEQLPERLQRVKIRSTSRGTLNEEIDRFRRDLIERALETSGGNQSKAANQLGVTRQALAYQIRELGILVKKTERGRGR